MKTLRISIACKAIWLVIFFLLLVAFPGNAAEIDEGMAKCVEIKEGATRLQCFDDLATQKIPLAECAKIEKDTDRLKCFDNFMGQKNPLAECEEKFKGNSAARLQCFDDLAAQKTSVMSQHWDLYPDPGKKKSTFALKPYRPNYFLPVAYNSSPNEDAALDVDPKARAQHNEVKFQLSFKVRIWDDVQDVLKGTLKDLFKEGRGIDIWVAYTQLSFWQLYNSAFSAPFRDTNYEPELLVNFRTLYKIPGLQDFKLQFVNVGFNHQSNGRSVPLSRSWNRIVANAGFEKGNFNLLLKTWYRIPEDELNDDNPDITRYMGYGELWGIYYWKNNRFAIMLRNNLRQNNLGAVQLDWSIPLSLISDKFDKFSFYIQYFNGYGESLLDYNTSMNRISAGLMLVDWN